MALLAVAAGLGSCNGGGEYSNYETPDYGGAPVAAAIKVYGPQFYRRESLINDRRQEDAYLRDKLKDSVTVPIEPQLLREVEAISSLAVQAGVNFDPAARINFQNNRESNALQQQIAVTQLQMQLESLQRDLALLRQSLPDRAAPLTTPGGSIGPVSPISGGVAVPGGTDLSALATRIDNLNKMLTDRLAAKVDAPRPTTAKAAPREEFLDRQAYRDEIRLAINRNALDDLHDRNGHSLFRLQFHATVMPRPDYRNRFAMIQMQVQKPADAAFGKIYLAWLSHLAEQLNTRENGAIGHDENIVTLSRVSGAFGIAYLYVGDGQDGKCNTVVPPAANEGDRSIFLKQEDYDAYQSTLRISANNKTPKTADNQLKNVSRLIGSQYSSLPPITPVPGNCIQVAIPTPPPRSILGIAETEKPESARTQTAPAAFDKLFSSAVTYSMTAADGSSTESSITRTTENMPPACKIAIQNSVVMRNYLHAFAIHGLASRYIYANSAGLSEAQVRTLMDDIRQYHDNTLDYAVKQLPNELKRNAACKDIGFTRSTFNQFLQTIGLSDAVPVAPRFVQAVTNSMAKPRVYSVSPSFLGQRMSTAARAADAVQMMLSLSGSVPSSGIGASAGLASMRASSGKADALERMPLVVGFAEADQTDTNNTAAGHASDRFGWILGPRARVDTERKKIVLEHMVEPYDMFADLTLPVWWPDFKLHVIKQWAPDLQAPRIDTAKPFECPANAACQTVDVTMPTASGDLDNLTDMVASHSFASQIRRVSIERIEPARISACHNGTVIFQVSGQNAWRTSEAYFGGMRQTGTPTVLPDMNGVAVEFDIAKLPRRPTGTSTLDLTIWTPAGGASRPIAVDGSKLDADSCGKELAGSAPRYSVNPQRLNACMANQIFVTARREGDKISALWLAGQSVALPATTGASASFNLAQNWTSAYHTTKAKTALLTIELVSKDNLQEQFTHELPIDATACDKQANADDGGPKLAVLAAAPGGVNLCAAAPTLNFGNSKNLAKATTARLTLADKTTALSADLVYFPITGNAQAVFAKQSGIAAALLAQAATVDLIDGKGAKLESASVRAVCN